MSNPFPYQYDNDYSRMSKQTAKSMNNMPKHNYPDQLYPKQNYSHQFNSGQNYPPTNPNPSFFDKLWENAPQGVKDWITNIFGPKESSNNYAPQQFHNMFNNYNNQMKGGYYGNQPMMFAQQDMDRVWNNAPQNVKDWINNVYVPHNDMNINESKKMPKIPDIMTGGQYEDEYKKKYLKYKQKYLKLKNNQRL